VKRLFLVVALAACSGPATSLALKGGAAPLGLTCHPQDTFYKKHSLIHRGQETSSAKRPNYAFIGATVWNHLRQVTVTAYPIGGAGGSEQFTILPGHAVTQQFNPPTKGVTITVPSGSHDPGPGVEINATACKR
jgi:hypothetical protein